MNKCLVGLLFSIILFSGCGKESKIETVTTTQYVPVSASEADEINSVVQEENTYRLSVGQAIVSRGLTCTLYANITGSPAGIPGTPVRPSDGTGTVAGSLPSSTLSYVLLGNFDSPNDSANVGINILPENIRNQYTQWYLVRCTGYIVIVDTGYYNFSLTSDDASLLYVDNVLVVNNNGNHGMDVRSGVRQLRRGVHQFRLDYMQGPGGGQGLNLSSNGSTVPAEILYR